jgi:TRAP-type C4-dicarboxylate transport system permease small subunit
METFRRAVGAADDAVHWLEKAFLIVVHGAIFVLVVAGVVLRYVFNDPLTWGEELIVGLFTWMVFIGASAAVRTHMHIRIDVMAPVYANPRMHWLNVATLLTGFAVLGIMLWASIDQVLQEAGVETPMLNVSKAWFVAAMTVGIVFMILHTLRLWLDMGAAAVYRGEAESVAAGEAP